MILSSADRYPDRVLVLSAIAGDVDSFNELVKRYRPAVVRTVRGLVGDPDQAQDAAQEAFLIAYRCLPQLSLPDAFGPWLKRIAVRCARRRARGEAARRFAAESLDEAVLALCPSLADRPDETVAATVRGEALRSALGRVPEPLAETVELRFMEDMPLARIAEYQGITVDGVKWRLRRALGLLRELVAADATIADALG